MSWGTTTKETLLNLQSYIVKNLIRNVHLCQRDSKTDHGRIYPVTSTALVLFTHFQICMVVWGEILHLDRKRTSWSKEPMYYPWFCRPRFSGFDFLKPVSNIFNLLVQDFVSHKHFLERQKGTCTDAHRSQEHSGMPRYLSVLCKLCFCIFSHWEK